MMPLSCARARPSAISVARVSARSGGSGARASASLSFSPRMSSIAMNVTPVGFADLVDDGDIGMLEGGRGARLLQQPRAAVGVVQQILGQDLERHFACQIDVEGAIDDAHAAAADFVEDLVVRERRPVNDTGAASIRGAGALDVFGGARRACDRGSIGASLCADFCAVWAASSIGRAADS